MGIHGTLVLFVGRPRGGLRELPLEIGFLPLCLGLLPPFVGLFLGDDEPTLVALSLALVVPRSVMAVSCAAMVVPSSWFFPLTITKPPAETRGR